MKRKTAIILTLALVFAAGAVYGGNTEKEH